VTFAHPLAWWLAALAVPIVVLHLHLRRRRVVEVSSLVLWRGVIADGVGRGRFRTIRDRLALAFVLAALAAFTVAAAGPVSGAAATDPRRLTIVIDASATMNAVQPDGGTRLAHAVRQAEEAMTHLAPQDELCVWAAGETPRVVVDPTTKHASAIDDGWAASGTGSSQGIATLAPPTLAETVRLAVRAAPGVAKRAATVLVLTDEVGAESLKDVPIGSADVRIGVVDVGREIRNAGIVACDLDPSDPGRLVVRVATTDGPPASRSLVLGADGVPVPLNFGADGAATATVPLGDLAAKGGLAEVRLDPADDFAEDDVARLVLPAAKPLAVAVVAAAPSPFLVQALRAMPSVADPARTTLVTPGAPASAFEGADVVVAEGVAPPAGKPALVFGGAGPALERPLLWGVGSHPVLAGVDLSPLRIESAVRVDPSDGGTTIVASAAGAVGVAGETGGVRRVMLGFRPDASTLPLEPAFPLLVRNALRWLAKPSNAPRYVAAGEPMPDGGGAVVPYPRPGDATSHAARTPSGAATTIRWIAPPGFRLSPSSPVSSKPAEDAVAMLADRHGDSDTRQRFGPRLAALGAVLLLAGALLLRRRRAPPTAIPPATGVALPTATREAATSSRA
jgi:hypothetical protein